MISIYFIVSSTTSLLFLIYTLLYLLYKHSKWLQQYKIQKKNMWKFHSRYPLILFNYTIITYLMPLFISNYFTTIHYQDFSVYTSLYNLLCCMIIDDFYFYWCDSWFSCGLFCDLEKNSF